MTHLAEIDSALWDNLPVAAIVIETSGTVRHVNDRVSDFTGYTPADLVGGSLFDLIVHDDLMSIIDSMAHAEEFDNVILGPFRLRYIDADGDTNWCQAWALNTVPAIGFEGWVVTLSVETCADRLATALHGIASDAELGESLTTVAGAIGAFPTVADATFIIDRPDGGMDLWGAKPFADLVDHNLDDPGWRGRPITTETAETAVDLLPEPLRSVALDTGYRRLWTHTVLVDGIDRGVLVAWRRLNIDMTPNQRRHIGDCLDVAALAIARHDHRQLLRRAAYTDHLTGLGNRALLEQRSADPSHHTLSVLYIDIDDFKDVNDRYGHAVGDAMLRHVGTRLARVCGPSGEVFRIGGDEFVVVCGPTVNEHLARDLAQRLVTAIIEPVQIDGLGLTTAVSVGVATGAGGASIASMIERADRALIRAKRAGKGRWSDDAASSTDRLSHTAKTLATRLSSVRRWWAARLAERATLPRRLGPTTDAPATSD